MKDTCYISLSQAQHPMVLRTFKKNTHSIINGGKTSLERRWGLLLRSVPAASLSSAGPGGTASKTDIQQCKQQFLSGSE